MIRGVGVDVVDLDRFAVSLERTPGLRGRLFAESEQVLAPHSLAARWAAKEALVKALGGPIPVPWNELRVIQNDAGDPDFDLDGPIGGVLAARGIDRVHVSLSHDGGIATAFVVVESVAGTAAADADGGSR
ncbi:holo-ACP synthase [Agromyces seonyuensis]|uniref:Holo-[acyl-carrier-protein] synthase n=1 Tax=Agromyces seonyuensis TaxID=2662446 RepID=A0A6I4P0D4_9MICO|nr:holo-ACP synthase [Agromyces seonyuensis]